MTVKCLSLHQPYADYVVRGFKSIETRRWKTSYRGDLLIVSTREPGGGGLHGYALGMVALVDVRDMKPWDWELARCPAYPGAWAWILERPRRLAQPFKLRGCVGIYERELPSRPDSVLTGTSIGT